MIQAETITWIPFNAKSTPNDDDTYLVQDKDGIQYTSEYVCGSHDYRWWINDGVVAFAIRPKPYDPAAKTFNFMTALARMKEKDGDYAVKSLVSGNHWGVLNGVLRKTKPGTISVSVVGFPSDFITIPEIDGLWEEV